jgi:hypothetical protein
MIVRSQTGNGFILPFVALALSILALSIFAVIDVVERANGDLARLKTQTLLERDATSAEARFAHLLLTESINHRGLRIGGSTLGNDGLLGSGDHAILRDATGQSIRNIPFDGRTFRRQDLLIRVQDEAGLLNVNARDINAMATLLSDVGASRSLALRLASHIDQATRERTAYSPSAAGNALVNVDDLRPGQARGFLERVSALPFDQRLNLNTAPPSVLRAVLGIDMRAIDRLIAARQTQAIMSLRDVASVSGVAIAGSIAPVGGLPARTVRFSASRNTAGATLTYQSQLIFGIDGDPRPITIRVAPRTRRLWMDERRGGDGGYDPLPDSATLLAARNG